MKKKRKNISKTERNINNINKMLDRMYEKFDDITDYNKYIRELGIHLQFEKINNKRLHISKSASNKSKYQYISALHKRLKETSVKRYCDIKEINVERKKQNTIDSAIEYLYDLFLSDELDNFSIEVQDDVVNLFTNGRNSNVDVLATYNKSKQEEQDYYTNHYDNIDGVEVEI